MPRCWPDRLIMFSVIALVAWTVIGLPLFDSLTRPSYQPTNGQAPKETSDSAGDKSSWLTKDAAGFFTFVLVIVGSFQVGLFLWQLWLIRESLDDAKIAAEAAKESADAAKESADAGRLQAETAGQTLETIRDTAVRQLRAYVFAEPTSFENQLVHIVSTEVGVQPYRGITGTKRILKFVVTFRNSGQTPAYEFRQSTAWGVFDEPAVEANFVTEPQGLQSRLMLAAGAGVSTRGEFDISEDDNAAFQVGQKSFYVFGQIEYNDAFQKFRRARFRLMYGRDNVSTNEMVYAKAGNEEIKT